MNPFPSFVFSVSRCAYLVVCAGLLLSGAAARAADAPKPMTVITNEASKWIPLYGEQWWDYYHPEFEGFFPGGRSNLMHDRYLARIRFSNPRTTEWQIFNRKYIFDGDYYAVEWFYRATNTNNGFKQWEATLGIGRIKDGKCVLWTEYFDDSVGELQEISLMPFYSDKEPAFPWPEKAKLSLPYRP